MRIISGKYKGHLVSFKADHIRPTTDRVKETLFNILISDIDGARVLDLFSGTGSLGIEALSRGAKDLVMVEKNRKSVDIMRANLKKFNVTEPVEIIQKDVISFLKSYGGPPFDIIFADPPFTQEMADEVMQAAATTKIFHDQSLMTIESGRREKIGEDYGIIFRYDVREFGDKYLSFFKRKPKETDEQTKTE